MNVSTNNAAGPVYSRSLASILRGMSLDLPSSVRPGSGASTVTETEEGRAFFQERLSIFGLCLFVLAGGSWLLMALSYWFGSEGLDEYSPFSAGGSLHLANALLAGALWWATRRERRPGYVLHLLDGGASLGLIAIWGLAGATLPLGIGGFVALLSFTLGTLVRAIVVPSTARRTLLIGVVGGALLVAFTMPHGGGARSVVGGAVATACWALSATTIATFASHTIFGLRREVQQARVLGQYTLEAKLGAGGMGDVWRASHALLRRPTAIKLLPPGRLDEKAIQRFEREVQLTARLRHPNTVAIYDYGRTRDGVFYYAMELLEGLDLERLVKAHGAQPAERVVHVLTQICGALAEAHDLGLVHRDIKPANVLLCPRRNDHEFAKLVDFGLVKTIEAGADAALTGINTLAGTPLYLSPEAIQAPDTVDARSDLYALGALAWFMLVGHPPFEANSIIEVCGQHLHAVPRRPSVALRASVPSDLEDIVLACLEKRPEDRPNGARELRQQLEACELAGRWTTERAIDWWHTHSTAAPSSEPPSPTGQTLALDVASRAAAPAR
jgi:eukaryotic-like serine/threonine-protein kinase